MDTETPKGFTTRNAQKGFHGFPDSPLPVHLRQLRFFIVVFS
jgi:hypothetical protein